MKKRFEQRGFEPNKEKKDFRELKPIDHWSASISIDGVSDDDLKAAISGLIKETGQSFMGFKNLTENTYIRTRYPRRKYGIPSVEDCRISMENLGEQIGQSTIEQQKVESQFQVALGLLEGYGDENAVHTVEEVKKILGDDFEVDTGEIFSLSPSDDGSIYTYTESIAIIRGDVSNVQKVYNLADRFKQERFTVDNLDTMQSHVVETDHCTSPDEE